MVEGLPPAMTVLDYLRGVERLTGTKEGCAEGDCGACTIAVARPGTGDSGFQAVNSCLMLLAQLDGLDVVTIEGLAGGKGQLHPVQQALAETDATQCGFCTPGFAMAMFAFSQAGAARDDEVIHDALAGNLCRCTGYRPIVQACRDLRPAPPGCLQNAGIDDWPCAAPEADTDYRNGAQIFHAPRTLAALAELRAYDPDAVLLGGGTDLGLRVSKDRETFPATIWTGSVPELKRIVECDDAVILGGAVTYSEALPVLERHIPAFAALVRRIGSRQIRNLGTFAGNLATASPIGDSIVCMIALDADVELRARDGARSLPVEDFIVGYRKTAMRPGEFIASLRIPLPAPGRVFRAYKLSRRFDQDISTVVVAFDLALDNGVVRDLRAVFGGMVAQAMRARACETALIGRPWRADALADIEAILARDFTPMSDHRGSAGYRLRAAANLLRRFHAETTAQQPAQVWTL